jgi:hypothetical protein
MIDRARDTFKRTKRVPGHFTWEHMDALSLDLAPNHFDLVCDLSLLDHCYLCSDADIHIRQLLGEIFRVLKVSVAWMMMLQFCTVHLSHISTA